MKIKEIICSLIFNYKESNIIDQEINSIWDSIINQKYENSEILLNDLHNVSLSLQNKQNYIPTHMLLTLHKRINNLYQLYKESLLPNGIKVIGAILKNRKSIGLIFHREGIKLCQDLVPWSRELFEKSDIIFEDNEFVIFKNSPVDNLIFLSNIAFDLNNNEIIYERVINENLSKRFFSMYILNLYN